MKEYLQSQAFVNEYDGFSKPKPVQPKLHLRFSNLSLKQRAMPQKQFVVPKRRKVPQSQDMSHIMQQQPQQIQRPHRSPQEKEPKQSMFK